MIVFAKITNEEQANSASNTFVKNSKYAIKFCATCQYHFAKVSKMVVENSKIRGEND